MEVGADHGRDDDLLMPMLRSDAIPFHDVMSAPRVVQENWIWIQHLTMWHAQKAHESGWPSRVVVRCKLCGSIVARVIAPPCEHGPLILGTLLLRATRDVVSTARANQEGRFLKHPLVQVADLVGVWPGGWTGGWRLPLRVSCSEHSPVTLDREELRRGFERAERKGGTVTLQVHLRRTSRK